MQAIEKVSVVQQVEERIVAFIRSDEIQIGDKLPTEMALCAQLAVGRGTVREALRSLQARGYIELIPGRGAFLQRKEEQRNGDIATWFQQNEVEIRDLIEVRTAIEPLAVRLAIERCSAKTLKKLETIQRQSVAAAERRDAAALAQCDEKFHSSIVEASHNKALIQIYRPILDGLRSFRGKTFHIPGNVDNFIPAHAAILEAMEKKDSALAQKKLLDHLDCVAADLEQSKDFK